MYKIIIMVTIVLAIMYMDESMIMTVFDNDYDEAIKGKIFTMVIFLIAIMAAMIIVIIW